MGSIGGWCCADTAPPSMLCTPDDGTRAPPRGVPPLSYGPAPSRQSCKGLQPLCGVRGTGPLAAAGWGRGSSSRPWHVGGNESGDQRLRGAPACCPADRGGHPCDSPGQGGRAGRWPPGGRPAGRDRCLVGPGAAQRHRPGPVDREPAARCGRDRAPAPELDAGRGDAAAGRRSGRPGGRRPADRGGHRCGVPGAVAPGQRGGAAPGGRRLSGGGRGLGGGEHGDERDRYGAGLPCPGAGPFLGALRPHAAQLDVCGGPGP